MMSVDQVVAALPRRFPGPGGACAVIRDGEVIVRHAWGWANAELRIPFTPATLFRICSITKQFTCALALDQVDDVSALDAAIGDHLPGLEAPPRARHLCHNQSGLRDYWAVAMLHGAPAESAFGDIETREFWRAPERCSSARGRATPTATRTSVSSPTSCRSGQAAHSRSYCAAACSTGPACGRRFSRPIRQRCRTARLATKAAKRAGFDRHSTE